MKSPWGDGRWINEATVEKEREGEAGRDRDREIERNPENGWKRAIARRVERRRKTRHTPRVKDGASDRKTVIGSESEDNYNDGELHKKGKKFSCECRGGE